MQEFKVTKDSEILIPNKEHKNFTSTNEIIKEGTILSGRLINIEGKRRGEPFLYRLFVTNDNTYIYQQNVEPMRTTEVMLGADSAQTETVINLKQNENFSKAKIFGIVGGGLAGFGYSKYKQHDWKRTFMYSVIGATLGLGAAYLFDRNRAIEVTKSK